MFSSEKELVSCITKYIGSTPSFVKGKKQSIFTELNLGYGIADVVAVGYEEAFSKRKNCLAYFDISLLSLIEKEDRISLEDIVYITKSPSNKVSSSLSSLINEDFITFRKGYYFSHKKYVESLTDSIAIEAKLKDWKRALKQAYRYKWFSNKSFVFLPVENIGAAQANLESFEKYNVGLASVSRENGLEVVYEPREESPISGNMRIALNEYLIFQNNAGIRGF